MKILTFLTCAILIAPTAYAATKCVPLNDNYTTCKKITEEEFQLSLNDTEWSTTCTTNDKTVTVKGIMAVGTQSGDTIKFDASEFKSGAYSCYCKIISPFISKWFSPGNGIAARSDNCAFTCKLYLGSLGKHSGIWEKLTANLSD